MTAYSRNGKLTVQLYENVLTGKKDEYSGKIRLRGLITTEDLASDVCAQTNEFSREQLLRACELMDAAMRAYIADGFSVRLGVGTVHPVINGCFKGAGAQFDSEQHSVSLGYSASRPMREILKTVIIEIIGAAKTGGIINRVYDVRSGEENGVLTVGRNLKIYGSRLCIEGTQEGIGVWFVSANDEMKRVKVEPHDIVDNTNAQVTVIIPELETGDWYVEIVSQTTGKKGVFVKQPRLCRFDVTLSVL